MLLLVSCSRRFAALNVGAVLTAASFDAVAAVDRG